MKNGSGLFHILPVMLLLCLVLLLSSCGTPSDGGEDTTSAETTAQLTVASDTVASPKEDSAAQSTAAPVIEEIPARDGWRLGIPPYDGGKLDNVKYSCGQGITTSDATSYMQVADATNMDDFNAYISRLEASGYTREYYKEIDRNGFACCYNGENRIYCYYIASLRRTNIILDKTSCSLDSFCYKLTPGTTEKTTLYAYGIKGTGQLLLVHMSDNSWIINDGGTENVDKVALWRFMREKSGLTEDEMLTVSLWYITHAHNDHMTGVTAMIEKYHDKLKLERVMWNIPDQSIIAAGSSKAAQKRMQTAVSTYYPEVLYLKNHTGMTVEIGDVEIQFLATHEDATKKFVSGEWDDFNNTSSVAVFRFSGISVFVPGDSKSGTIDSGEFMCNAFTLNQYKCDIMQVAHHGYNKVSGLYKTLYPYIKYAVFENSKAEGVDKGSGSGPAVYAKLGAERCFFTDFTYGFTVINGEITVTKY